MDEVEIPPYFLCPISLEIMRDPVTVATGITYDRSSIEKWLFSGKNTTCPVTKQPLVHSDDVIITPNHTLRRLIQGWCTLHASSGVERFPTPKPPVSKLQLQKLLSDTARNQASSLLPTLRTLRSLAAESCANKRCMESSGVVPFLASVIAAPTASSSSDPDSSESAPRARDEAVGILHSMKISDAGLRSLLKPNGAGFVGAMADALRQGSYETRACGIMLLKSALEVADPAELMALPGAAFVEMVDILKDKVSAQATKAALLALVQVCPWGRNRVKAAEAGAVGVLVEGLLEGERGEKRACELGLMALDQLCGCAEGRAELVGHAGGLAVVAKKVLRVSAAASERAVRVLLAVAKYSGSPSVVQEMMDVGVVAKLCLVMQVGCGGKTKEKAAEILRLHGRAWRNSNCLPYSLLSSYPS